MLLKIIVTLIGVSTAKIDSSEIIPGGIKFFESSLEDKFFSVNTADIIVLSSYVNLVFSLPTMKY